MFYKFFAFFMFLALLSFNSLAINAQTCSQEAIERANNQYLQEISNYISEFSNQHNNQAVQELSKIKPTESFKKKYEQEIKQLSQKGYQPPQQFCDDVYKNLNDLHKQIKEIIKKYNTSNKTH